MCLAVPMKLVERREALGVAELDGVRREVSMASSKVVTGQVVRSIHSMRSPFGGASASFAHTAHRVNSRRPFFLWGGFKVTFANRTSSWATRAGRFFWRGTWIS